MRQQEKQSVYLARATRAEEQAAKAENTQDRRMWMRVATEYREAARDAELQRRGLNNVSDS